MPSPDHDRDVIVHRFMAVDALTGAEIGDRWSVWCGRDSEGAFDTEGEAFAAAFALAGDREVPIWLIQTGLAPTQLA
jgi:hypothetical protein